MSNENGDVHVLEETTLERDLGVLISNDLKQAEQVKASAAKANRVLGMLKKSFKHRGLHLWRTLYMTYVRPHLEFAVQAWSPYLAGDVDVLERVQNRATKAITVLRHLPAEERNRRLGLTSLVLRRERGDLIQQYKFLRGIDEINWHHPPKTMPSLAADGPAGAIRGHNMRIEAQQVKGCEQRFNFFTRRIADPWNALSQHVIDSPTVNVFKNRIDEFYRNNQRF